MGDSFPRQGGFLLVRLLNPPPGLEALEIIFNGVSYQMLSAGDHRYGVIGLRTDIPIGEYAVEIESADSSIASGTVSVGEGGFQYESIELPESSTALLSDQAAVDQERQTLARIYAGFTAQGLWSGAWIVPAPGTISNAFGLQRSINGGPYFPHSGTDLVADKGTPVAAAASGTVVLAQQLYLYGNVVVVDHGAGVFSSYNHLDSIAVTTGQSVTKGDLIGYVGETGFVSGPHLHWEAVIGGVRTDPILWTLGPVEP
jgi:murein DD-endopeptidase MepM/ murein hydrolase activator NlpD